MFVKIETSPLDLNPVVGIISRLPYPNLQGNPKSKKWVLPFVSLNYFISNNTIPRLSPSLEREDILRLNLGAVRIQEVWGALQLPNSQSLIIFKLEVKLQRTTLNNECSLYYYKSILIPFNCVIYIFILWFFCLFFPHFYLLPFCKIF